MNSQKGENKMELQTNDGTATAMPVSMAVEVEESPSINPTEPGKVVNRLRDLKTSARDQLMIDPRIILIDDGENPRNYDLPENHAHLDELKRSIREMGVLIPLLVRYDAARKAAVVVDGECRLRAVLELITEGEDIDTVPTIQVPGGNESDRLLTRLTANTGKPLSKWESGIAFRQFYNFGWSEEKIATKTGMTERFIREAMELADAPDEVKALLSSQAVTPSLALAELRANGAAAVETLKAAAVAAQSTGKKGPAKRAKKAKKQPVALNHSKAPETAPAPPAASKSTIPPSAITKAILALVDGIPVEDLNDPSPDAVAVVKVQRLLKVLSFAVTAEDLKAVGAKAN